MQFKSLVGWYCAILIAVGVTVGSGLVSIPKRGYSEHLVYRWQTERLLQGDIAMADDPSALGWDLAWDNGKVQQVWGLGVPILRLPFEIGARIFGLRMFPDRVAFAVYLGFVVYLLLRLHWKLAPKLAPKVKPIWMPLALLPTILFPPFLRLCNSRFLVYEEVIAYGFLIALVLIGWTVVLSYYQCWWSFLCLTLVSGLIAFIRPTFVFYGIASVVIAAVAHWRGRHGKLLIFSGATIFLAGVGLLLWSNTLRFGSPLEFGHSLNLNMLDPMRYASRFDHPYRSERIGAAAKELFSLLFLAKSTTWSDSYQSDAFPGQSETFRWREIYLLPYGLIVAIFVLGAYINFGWRFYQRLRFPTTSANLSPSEILTSWSLMAGIPLFAFYIRCPFISSRYLLDFGPAFAAAVWAFWLVTLNWTSRSKVAICGWLILFLGWWSTETLWTKPGGWERTWTKGKVLERMAADELRASREWSLPVEYTNGFNFSKQNIPYNGSGWTGDGATKACVVLFVQDPDSLIIDVAPSGGLELHPNNYDCIQAKIGLEFLERESIRPTVDGMRIVFRGPQRPRYARGLQVMFLGMVPVEALSTRDSSFRLLRVAWSRSVLELGRQNETPTD
ncbi:MAG TPA: hypothetical protein VFZ59_13705 [Verrucomicrobiae bacterium]|nr:hypothetical protein [Verrucomicrobiae bacterium]